MLTFYHEACAIAIYAANRSQETLKAKIDKNQAPFMLDVRTPEEWDICRIEGSVLIPMNEIQSRLDEIPEETEIVVICHHGIRSAQVLSALARTLNMILKNSTI